VEPTTHIRLCVIAGCRRKVDIIDFLGCYAVLIDKYLRFGTTYRPQLQGPRNQKRPLIMELLCCPETQVRIYNCVLRKNPERSKYRRSIFFEVKNMRSYNSMPTYTFMTGMEIKVPLFSFIVRSSFVFVSQHA
jgi:hypothetical protein